MMENWIIYMVKAACCLTVFYLCYSLLFRRRSFYQLNRFYLMYASILSFIIPLLELPEKALPQLGASMPGKTDLATEKVAGGESQFIHWISQPIQSKVPELMLSWADLLVGIYWVGVVFMTVKFLLKLIRLVRIYRNSRKTKIDGQTMRLTRELPTSSFFHLLFWNDKNNYSPEAANWIVKHERIHARHGTV